MKSARGQRSSRTARSRELPRLRARLAEAEETIRAIRGGEVDAVVVNGEQGPRVFTLESVDQAYRVLMQSMSEGALTLTADKMILYANQCFARMVKCPLEQVIGSSFSRFLSSDDTATLRPALKRAGKANSRIQVLLRARDGSQVPVQISICPLARRGFNRATVGIVVTDMTEVRRHEEMLRTLSRQHADKILQTVRHSEEMLRALSHRQVQAQEAERGRVALELRNHITQLLCASLVRSQVLADMLAARDEPSRTEAIKLRELLGHVAEEVERISRELWPSVLDDLGLAVVLRDTSTEFAKRTGVSVNLVCVPLTVRLSAEIELTLYRILQEALKNVEKHGRARHVAVRLRQQGDFIQFAIKDDGIGFNPDHPAKRNGKRGLDLFSMRERAAYLGGALKVKSARGAGTEVVVRIPLIDKGQAVD